MKLSVDSNILVYLVDRSDPVRQGAALETVDAMSRRDAILTLQAIAEFRHVSARKRIASRPTIQLQYEDLLRLFGPPVAASLPSFELAVLAWEAGRFSFWDSMLLACAGAAGCDAVISEDMHDGATLDGVRVIGAFDAQGAVSLAARTALGIA